VALARAWRSSDKVPSIRGAWPFCTASRSLGQGGSVAPPHTLIAGHVRAHGSLTIADGPGGFRPVGGLRAGDRLAGPWPRLPGGVGNRKTQASLHPHDAQRHASPHR
jgi:hypothetical protein